MTFFSFDRLFVPVVASGAEPSAVAQVRPLDLIVLGIYLLGMLAVGVYFSRRSKSTEEYFLGGRAFPAWAIGLSMLGTSISSITFLAFPAAAYKLDWRQLVSNLTLPLVAVLAVVIFIPFFRRHSLTTAFEYLEDRFGTPARLYGVLSFILLQVLRLGTVLYLVSLPVSILTGVALPYVIVAVGVFIAFYTVAGGFEVVIWTDVVQAIVLWFGGLLCFGFIAWNLPGGVGQIFEVGMADHKFSLGPMTASVNEETFWVVAIVGIFNWLAMYSSDQNVIQRYAAAKSLSGARRATILYSVLAVPTWIFFFFLGTCVYVWYQVNPSPAVDTLEADGVFPYFILTQIPAGLAGLTIAGVLAAAMSSLDSSINAIATVTTVDLLKPYLARKRDDRFYLVAAKIISTFAAVLMIAGAILFSSIEKNSMNDINWIVSSVFGGCLVGLFLIGFFTRRVDGFSATVAIGCAILLNTYLGLSVAKMLPTWLTLPLHKYLVGLAVNLVFVVVAYGLSWFRRPTDEQREKLAGLTVWTPNREIGKETSKEQG